MKKIILLVSLSVMTLFAKETLLDSILKNVSIVNVNDTIKNAQILQKNYNAKNFKNFIISWKKVEAFYFAGDIDENYLDTPRYIDVFHNLKENLNEQMQRVIDSKDEPQIALFKHSFKTVNALEYVLFNDNTITKREKELANVITNTIISNLEDIKSAYEEYLSRDKKDEQWENGLIMNALISSTYKLKEWRIKVAKKEQEYILSDNTYFAIEAILEANKEIIGNQSYYNFANMAKKSGAKKETVQAQTLLNNAIESLKNNPKDLYKAVNKLHVSYFLSLIEQLSITAKILDADGD
ncbi:imelysin family protein [uncultured Arcobacter sp.]|uniref:imelysin family protein n=1 Tax=uncultured Arcobacter sp. TaxID=165434 RepID=UPI0026279D60|nr:imelysin family protein [uncultured Arcobacter sp.]